MKIAIIYKKQSIRLLNEYQIYQLIEQLKRFAYRIENPTYLSSHQKLLDAARSTVDITYSFKKEKSRSKKYCEVVESTTTK